MKNMIMISMLFFTFGTAQAETSYDYDAKSTELLSVVVNHCPIQFIQAMAGANRVGKAAFSESTKEGVVSREYTIVTVAGGYAPSFQSYDVATLKIARQTVNRPSHGVATDRPTQWNTTCKLVPAKK